MILHPVVPPGLKHHPSYLQRFCCYRFQQGVMDEKMLEKLAAHDVQDISELFSLADKCARAAEGHAWHSQPASEVGKGSKPKANAAAQRNDKNTNRKKKKKAGGNNKPLAGAPTAVVAAMVAGGGRGPHGDKRPW
jgi:hypothetical protein